MDRHVLWSPGRHVRPREYDSKQAVFIMAAFFSTITAENSIPFDLIFRTKKLLLILGELVHREGAIRLETRSILPSFFLFPPGLLPVLP